VTTSAADQQTKYPVRNDPPNIIFSSTPAVLALIEEQPVLGTPTDHLQKVINTRSLIFFDSSKNMYYLALMNGWVEASKVEGPWSLAKHEPKKEFAKLNEAATANNQNEILGNAAASPEDSYGEAEAPTVYVRTVPAELLLSQGLPPHSHIGHWPSIRSELRQRHLHR
jgi:hypothetical protein